MSIARAAIVSDNKDLALFFSNELRIIDISVDIYISDQILTGDYDLVIVDIDTVSISNIVITGAVVRVSSNISNSKDSTDPFMIPWPISIEQIHEICLGLVHGDGIQHNTEKIFADESNVLYSFDDRERIVIIGDKKIKLSVSEHKLLERLCASHGEVVSRKEIMDILGAQDGNISDVYICRLRKKLEMPLGRRLIFTERNVGYRTDLVLNK